MACTARPNFAHELVTPTHNRPDQVALRESLAQRLYLGVQVAVLDDPARPDPAHQLVFADDGAICLNQCHEHIESTPAELHRPAVGEHFATLRQDPETAELEARWRFG
jgi:hypothetical protein